MWMFFVRRYMKVRKAAAKNEFIIPQKPSHEWNKAKNRTENADAPAGVKRKQAASIFIRYTRKTASSM